MRCESCGNENVSDFLGICKGCIVEKEEGVTTYPAEKHAKSRGVFGVPETIPRGPDGRRCKLCGNECQIPEGGRGYCGLRANEDGKLRYIMGVNAGLMHAYYDPLPTNCCASWFCPASLQRGYNLAVFFYGCNFNCLFCQNHSHKILNAGKRVTVPDFINLINDRVRCICFFGGSPEPQLPFAIKASKAVSDGVRICWEWNGCSNPKLARKAAEISYESGGIVKFDLKTYSKELSLALSGVDNERAYENFRLIAEEFYDRRSDPMLTATTLLVPYYVDEDQVSRIAKFIADVDPDIPYSLLVFHGDFMMRDLPVTPKSQVTKCYKAAKRYLKNVWVGNLNLLV